ncbi:hypothetical protein [Pararhizobium sp. PWRC1-1]
MDFVYFLGLLSASIIGRGRRSMVSNRSTNPHTNRSYRAEWQHFG